MDPRDSAGSDSAGGDSALNAQRRTRELEQLANGDSVDVLVIGGGITGVGVALDAVTRGLSVALVEKHDLAFGTSRWSSKLAHGGLRYLASGNVGIARESAVERGILMTRTAPHLVRAMPQLVPLLPETSFFGKALVRTGFLAGDALRMSARTPASVLPRSRTVSAARARELAPAVKQENLRGALTAFDGQLIDDARLVVGIARTAASHGARILTRVGAYDVSGTSATLRDELTGSEFLMRARVVVNATGVWADQVDSSITLRPSRGTHLVLDAARLGNPTAALTVPIPGETNRFVFALPAQLGRIYLGLTDEAAPGPVPDVPTASEDEIDFLLDTVNTALEVPLTREDVLGTFAGLRPLLDTGEGSTADLSRNHAVVRSDSGLVTVVGGKLTTYRKMAEDAVDAAVEVGSLSAGACRTRALPLVGAASPVELKKIKAPASLVVRYGTEAEVVAAASSDRLRSVADLEICGAEFDFAVSHEGALDVDDVLDRRTRIGLVASDRERALGAAEQAFHSV
ncbi:glycerol-3-phosphate dehydrogenase/oxidase [Rhodococcus sp. WS1]|uniref:glycerol-3-phosphate dehydrogenase/oxidase n=1 Tax=unclassified Rhodococcus (in: high G+C Gram-positive bacteria) TaxID=192944 RepID=UPI0011437803|nr:MULTISPECIES: glycerol-3-phosphate dehydrogenase/oxidase [unclassified Rhodococcus (in: high G+C Gram-positive bacteria)]ROZ58906.1 glycerol-3-phosphate dehydrogenase/oxidase [Rhodococcus sp. WS1]TQC36162.1 glycerol-3-phosphate dehydrogenase/oxidase [Rhodococcus sp. WS7]